MLSKRVFAEFLGTLLLIGVVVGSGIMGNNLAGGNVAIALMANAVATGAGLYVLIQIFGPISGAHFNPIVSAYAFLNKDLKGIEMMSFWGAQLIGGVLGVFLIHFIFEVPVLQFSQHARDGAGQWVSEIVATFGLLLTIASLTKFNSKATASGVACYITSAYWFTSSTSFANPAVTFARMWTDSFSGIAPHSILGFIVAQFFGLLLFCAVWKVLAAPELESESSNSQQNSIGLVSDNQVG